MTLRRKSVLAAMCVLVALMPCAAWLGWWLLPPLDPDPYVAVPASGALLDRTGRPLYVAITPEGYWSLPETYGDFSPFLVKATVAAEDQRFRRHWGVDPVAVVRAAWQNLRGGGVASGASTLTMQLINLGGHHSRSLTGKAWQALYALRIEKAASKDTILAAYLNRAPYGMNLTGAEAAAWRYFGKTARTLSLPEAALLAGLPKAPGRLNPLEHPDRARVRRDYVLRRMLEEGYVDADTYNWAVSTSVSASWHDFPRSAPHLAAPLESRLAAGGRVPLTLDPELQARIEALLPRYLKRFDNAITNAAVLIVDAETGEVLARAGSANFFHTPGGGQVDACRAARSPGSTLKPFLYGWAMQQQMLFPSEVLLDDVLDYGSYAPGNFDGRFNGPVTAAEALRYSLNVPAVALLGRAGASGFLDWLRNAGLDTLFRPAEDYGLGLAIGNCEVRLEELARLYLSVASLGSQNVLRLYGDEAAQPAVFSEDVCRALYGMLEQPFPKELSPSLTVTGGGAEPVCWKTGTSTGYHDAWTFAFNRHYLVAVWLGNNDGTGARQLVGARAALPLAATIFRDLPPKSSPAWPAPGADDRSVRFCAASGLPATDACPETFVAMLPASFWQHRICGLHPVSQAGIGALVERPAGPARWDLASLDARSVVPGATGGPILRALAVTVPAPGAEYVMSGASGGDRLRLASSLGEGETLDWFVDGRYLGASTPSEPMYWTLVPGPHTVACVATDGRTDMARFSVTRPSVVVRNE